MVSKKVSSLLNELKGFFTYEVATDIGHLLRLETGNCVKANGILLIKTSLNTFSTTDGEKIQLSNVALPAEIIRF